MYDLLEQLIARLGEAVQALDSAAIDGEAAAKLVSLFCRAENFAAAGRTLAAKRALETRSWQGRGFRTPAQWIAANAGSSVTAAIGILDTARGLDAMPATRSALIGGHLSQAQAAEIAVAVQADPSAEPSLLDAIEQGATHRQLHERCASVVSSAQGDEDAHERARRGRYFRHRFDGTSVLIVGRLAPADAAPMIAYADKAGMQLWEKARRSRTGPIPSRSACRADAITEAFNGVVKAKVVVNLHCSQSAFERGHTVAGELCELDGVGAVSVSTARALAHTGSVRRLGGDDADITRVRHLRRDMPARLRSALEARDRSCVVPACDVTSGLEIDHRIPLKDGGTTSYDNLARLCGYHHYLKTHHGFVLAGKPGSWKWSPPPPEWKPERRFNRNEPRIPTRE